MNDAFKSIVEKDLAKLKGKYEDGIAITKESQIEITKNAFIVKAHKGTEWRKCTFVVRKNEIITGTGTLCRISEIRQLLIGYDSESEAVFNGKEFFFSLIVSDEEGSNLTIFDISTSSKEDRYDILLQIFAVLPQNFANLTHWGRISDPMVLDSNEPRVFHINHASDGMEVKAKDLSGRKRRINGLSLLKSKLNYSD